MFQRPALIVTCVALLATVGSGCATLSTVQAEKGRGAFRVYSAPFKTVWEQTFQAVSALGLQIAVPNQKEGYLLAETGISAFSWGEKIAIFVEKVDESHTRVEVVSRRVVTTNVFAYDWEPRILNEIDKLMSGAQLPESNHEKSS